jgi:hypothetical protein
MNIYNCPCIPTKSEISCFELLKEEHDIPSLTGKAAKYSKRFIQKQQKREESTEYDAGAAGADMPGIGLAAGCTYCIAGMG